MNVVRLSFIAVLLMLVSRELYPQRSYNLADFNDQNAIFNQFAAGWGLINASCLTTTFDISVFRGQNGASLRMDYDFTNCSESLAGLFHDLWPGPKRDRNYGLDLTDDLTAFDEIHFYVRTASSDTIRLHVELKDYRDDPSYTASYDSTITIAPGQEWQRVIIPINSLDSPPWSYANRPDLTSMKVLTLILRREENPGTGSVYIDDLEFVKTSQPPFSYANDEELLDFIARQSFNYFLHYQNRPSGMFQDNARNVNVVSIAGLGFGLASLCVGAERGWITREKAATITLNILHKLWNSPMGPEPSGRIGYRGFFYHLLRPSVNNPDLVTRDGDSELSIIDTALGVMGALVARSYFDRGDPTESMIRMLADNIYKRVDWNWMYDCRFGLFHLAWKPEADSEYQYRAPDGIGYFQGNPDTPFHWGSYADELILMSVLGIGSPTHPVPVEAFYNWRRNRGHYPETNPGFDFVRSDNGALFTYFFAHCFLPLKDYGQDLSGIDWWENSRIASLQNRQFCIDHHDSQTCNADNAALDQNQRLFTTYSENEWGLSDTEVLHISNGEFCPTPASGFVYKSYGAGSFPPNGFQHEGFLAPYGAGSTIVFFPPGESNSAMQSLKFFFEKSGLWHNLYGFGAAYSRDAASAFNGPAYNHNAFALQQGPLVLMIENYRSELLWNIMRKCPYTMSALDRIYGGESTFSDDFSGTQLDLSKWAIFHGEPIVSDGKLILTSNRANRSKTEVQSIQLFRFTDLELNVRSSNWQKDKPGRTDTSVGLEIFCDRCHYGIVFTNGVFGILKAQPETIGHCDSIPQWYWSVPDSLWDIIRRDVIKLRFSWAPGSITLHVNDIPTPIFVISDTSMIPAVSMKIRLNANVNLDNPGGFPLADDDTLIVDFAQLVTDVTVPDPQRDMQVPRTFSLEQSYPNPFNASESDHSTIIRYQLQRTSDVSLTIYNILGQVVRRLVRSTQNAGDHFVRWNGRDEAGVTVPSGIYLYQLRTNDVIQTRKLIVIR